MKTMNLVNNNETVIAESEIIMKALVYSKEETAQLILEASFYPMSILAHLSDALVNFTVDPDEVYNIKTFINNNMPTQVCTIKVGGSYIYQGTSTSKEKIKVEDKTLALLSSVYNQSDWDMITGTFTFEHFNALVEEELEQEIILN